VSLLLEYGLRIAPGFALSLVFLGLLPRELVGARLCIHLGLFVLLRDAMTPVGLWRIDDQPVHWLRLASDPVVLSMLALMTAGLCSAICKLEPELARRVVSARGPVGRGVLAGAIGAASIALPMVALTRHVPVELRGGHVAALALGPLFVFSLIGNAYEELLFRGFLQSLLAERVGARRAVVISGVAFAFGHVPLATTVTNIGAPILAFTAFEGLICAELYRRFGLLAAVVAHGGGIFLVASGLW
jgi:membrane protease YdiL (CAAX protease family)